MSYIPSANSYYLKPKSVVLYPAIGRIEYRQHSRRLLTLPHLNAARQHLVVTTRTHTHCDKHERAIECVEETAAKVTFDLSRI